MSMWETLGIEPTNDESAIKKAYRIKLRQHHPEDDPEGFKRVREAYEKVLAFLKEGGSVDDGEQDAADVNRPEHAGTDKESDTRGKDTPQQDEEAHPLVTECLQIFNDASTRLAPNVWEAWVEKSQLLPIDEQEIISNAVVNVVAARHWIPGEIIDVLWKGLGWNLLLTGTEKQTEIGEYLDDWRQQALWIPMEDIADLSDAEQRATLSFLRPFSIAFGRAQTDAMHYLLRQPTVTNMIPKPAFMVSLLQAFIACRAYPESVTGLMLDTLADQSLEDLGVEQLQVVAEIALKLGRADVVQKVTERFIALEAYADAAETQYFNTLRRDSLLAVCFAYLQQQWAPLPLVYWRTERRLFPAPKEEHDARLFDWVHGQLTGRDIPTINHRLDFAGTEGLNALLIQAFWAAHSGSYAWMSSLKAQLHAALAQRKERASDEDREIFALHLTVKWIEQALSMQPGCDTLRLKLAKYETDAFLDTEALTLEEVSSLSKEEWLECVRRHPLISDVWFRQLEEAAILVTDEIRERSVYPAYSDSLCFYRSVNPDYVMSSSYGGARFEGVFDWMLFFYSHLGRRGADKRLILDVIQPLPEHQLQGPLAQLLPFAQYANTYLPDALEGLDAFPEQFVFRMIVDNQVGLLTRTFEQGALMTMAKEGDIAAIMALSRLLRQEHFDEAVVFWNLVAAAIHRRPHFVAVVDWQQQRLMELREEKKLDKEFYEYSNPEFLHAMLTNNREWFTSPAELAENSPSDEAKMFHYPMCNLLTQLHLGLDDKGYDLSPLKALVDCRKGQTALQQEVTDIAVTQLDAMYQRHLDNDLVEKGRGIPMFSRGKLKWLVCLFAFAWFMVFFATLQKFDFTPEEKNIEIAVGVLMAMVFAIHTSLVWQVSRPMLSNSNKKKYAIYATLTVLAAMFVKSSFLAMVNLIAHFFSASGLSKLYVNGMWEKKVVKRKRVNLRAVLGFKDPKTKTRDAPTTILTENTKEDDHGQS
ncbi:DnaJ domain-containing protein [Enterovibrio baiacu]|uniref:DnaJ domain-containing protein n=1 Tax=Enterovibrio baiacu TaxID=2491023 RepID=UPI001012F640|nr:DnaJ domain-containing protein [Enterovibrio baiacu]MBE1275449.1 J domain-containing protein [Enterovibrio baiacu]